MAASLAHIHAGTPMGANLVAGGATFRAWAPRAHSVHVLGDFNHYTPDDASLLTRQNRVLVFHRWVEGEGHDVLVTVHLSPFNRYGYRVGFPSEGPWREVFNSDVYENWVNPNVVGNGGEVWADPSPLHGFQCSAAVVLPANSILVFGRWQE